MSPIAEDVLPVFPAPSTIHKIMYNLIITAWKEHQIVYKQKQHDLSVYIKNHQQF